MGKSARLYGLTPFGPAEGFSSDDWSSPEAPTSIDEELAYLLIFISSLSHELDLNQYLRATFLLVDRDPTHPLTLSFLRPFIFFIFISCASHHVSYSFHHSVVSHLLVAKRRSPFFVLLPKKAIQESLDSIFHLVWFIFWLLCSQERLVLAHGNRRFVLPRKTWDGKQNSKYHVLHWNGTGVFYFLSLYCLRIRQ